ncbi:MAG TPA: alpha/beta fold hydrolase [Jiangellales bacterium]|jgi:pimeloyl-ACP methyl ester carboxylesterase|nr:alpha/beta fold hydrolase [Jiangellales bacterium]
MVAPVECSTVVLHGDGLSYLDEGAGAPLVFVHGLLGSHRGWAHLVADLASERRVIAPDLLGHGTSAKPVGDYSLGSHAAILRDLLDHLGVERVDLVGHSLGGGIALQFTYLFPDRVARLVLVSSGGLGREVGLPLRAATLPGAELVLPLLASTWVRERAEAVGQRLARAGIRPRADVTEGWRGFVSLADAETRRAFLATSRSVIDPGGQTVTAVPRLSLVAQLPTLLVWGARDRLIPLRHGILAAQSIPGSRVEVFESAGHYPHLDDPDRFTRVLLDFVTTAA